MMLCMKQQRADEGKGSVVPLRGVCYVLHIRRFSRPSPFSLSFLSRHFCCHMLRFFFMCAFFSISSTLLTSAPPGLC
jgi:hypothetical protein